MTIKIANGAGFFGDNLDAPRLLVEAAKVDYLTLEYLAELTMSILARQRQKDPAAGYAGDFLDVLRSLVPALNRPAAIENRHKRRRSQSAACAVAAAKLLDDARIVGDTKSGGYRRRFATTASRTASPPVAILRISRPASRCRNCVQPVVSAQCLSRCAADCRSANQAVARIVITGRVADASLTVGPAMHEFQRRLGRLEFPGRRERCRTLDRMRRTSDRWIVSTLAEPRSGERRVSDRRDERRWIVRHYEARRQRAASSIEQTVIEQLVYEIGDPAHYLTPDVDVDFTTVEAEASGPNRVSVRGATGRPPTDTYKVSLAYETGFSASGQLLVHGSDCIEKARACGEMILRRVERAGFKLDAAR